MGLAAVRQRPEARSRHENATATTEGPRCTSHSECAGQERIIESSGAPGARTLNPRIKVRCSTIELTPRVVRDEPDSGARRGTAPPALIFQTSPLLGTSGSSDQASSVIRTARPGPQHCPRSPDGVRVAHRYAEIPVIAWPRARMWISSRAFVGEHRLQVVLVPDHRILQGDSVGAEDGPGLPGDLDGGPDVGHLAQADLLRGCPRLLSLPRCRVSNSNPHCRLRRTCRPEHLHGRSADSAGTN